MSAINIRASGYSDIDLSLFEKIDVSSFSDLHRTLSKYSNRSLMRLKEGKSIFYKNGVVARVDMIRKSYIKAHIDMMEYIYLYSDGDGDQFDIDDFDFYIKNEKGGLNE